MEMRTKTKYVGSMLDSEFPLKHGDVVTVKRGTPIFHRGEWRLARRTYKVKIHHFSAIWTSAAKRLVPYPNNWPEPVETVNGVLCPAICFPGSGGYWSDINLNDIPEAS